MRVIISIPVFVGGDRHRSAASTSEHSFREEKKNPCNGRHGGKETEGNEERLYKCGDAKGVVIVPHGALARG